MAQLGTASIQSVGCYPKADPIQQPPIQGAIERISNLRGSVGKALEVLSDTVTMLEQRLSVALTPTPPSAMPESAMASTRNVHAVGDGVQTSVPRSAMADGMNHEANLLSNELAYIEALTERLVNIRHRVELPL